MHRFFRSKHFLDPNVKTNFYLNLFDGALFSFAMSMVSLVTILPLLVKKITGSDFAIGLIPVIWAAGFNFPQIFFANYVRKIGFKKPLMLKTALGQRLPWLFISLIIFFVIEHTTPSVALILILAGLGLAAITGSLNLPGWFDLISKITPVKLRGRLFAYRSVLGAVLGIFGGWIVVRVLDTISFPNNFGLLYLFAFIVMMISYIFLLFLKEETPNPPKEQFNYSQFFKRLTTIIKSEKNYRNFLVSDSLLMLANMSHAFFTVYAIEKFYLSDGYAGTFTIVMMISMILGSIYFGYVADKFGHKINLVYASGFTAFACAAALLSPFVELYFIVFIGSALNLTLLQVSRLTIIAEICIEEDRPTYIALSNLVTAPFVLSGIFGGLLVKHFGYDTLFIIAGLFALASLIWLIYMVQEPRHKNTLQTN